MGGVTVLIVALLAAALGLWLSSLHSYMSLPPGHTFTDQNCALVGLGLGMIGSEDLALGRHSVLLITSGDLATVFTKGAAEAKAGGLWALDMREGGTREPVPLKLEGFPAGRRFQPHGLDVSNSTDRVYAISHNGDHSSVDIFDIEYRPSCLSLPWSCTPLKITFKHSLTSPLFPNSGINDLVEAGPSEVYVTQWQPFPFPTHGSDHPETVLEMLQGLCGLPINILGIKLTTVMHCRWGGAEGDSCRPATGQRFIGANGLTISGDGGTVFVNDPVDKRITVLVREKVSGSLTVTGSVPLPVAVDNIEYDDQAGHITLGTIPDMTKMGKPTVPGGAAELRPVAGGAWQYHSLVEHDGTKLSQISASSRLGSRLVLGSPFSEGLLLCTL